jgi:hypothetical protein
MLASITDIRVNTFTLNLINNDLTGTTIEAHSAIALCITIHERTLTKEAICNRAFRALSVAFKIIIVLIIFAFPAAVVGIWEVALRARCLAASFMVV